MMKLFSKSFWVFMIMLQTLIGIGAGLLYLSFARVDKVAVSASIGDLSLKGRQISGIKSEIQRFYGERLQKASLVLKIDDKTLNIPYRDIDAKIDFDLTVGQILEGMPQNGFDGLFPPQKRSYEYPLAVTYNSGKLIARLEEFLSSYETAPVSESYVVENDALKCLPAKHGVRVDYKVLEGALADRINRLSGEPFLLDPADEHIFARTNGNTYSGEPFTTIIAKSDIAIVPETKNLALDFLEDIDGKTFSHGEKIDLAGILDFKKASSDMEKDMLDRLATAVYQALLPIEGVQCLNRLPSKHGVAYAEPGLEAVIQGEGGNLVMENETGRPLLLLAELRNGRIMIYTVSTGELKSGILISQKRDEVPPPVITSVNRSLPKGETRIVSQGAPGFTAYVSLIIDNDRTELYHDQYQPVSRIIETGDSPVLSGSK